jgi:hypothetical protein
MRRLRQISGYEAIDKKSFGIWMAGMVLWSQSHFLHFHICLIQLPGVVLQRTVVATRMMNLCVCFLALHRMLYPLPSLAFLPFLP